MSNEHDDLSSAERAAKKAKCTCGISVSADCAVHGRHAARRFPMNAPHTSLAKLARQSDRGAKFDVLAVDEYKHIEPPRHPATDLVTALKLLKRCKAHIPYSRDDIERGRQLLNDIETFLKQFPNIK